MNTHNLSDCFPQNPVGNRSYPRITCQMIWCYLRITCQTFTHNLSDTPPLSPDVPRATANPLYVPILIPIVNSPIFVDNQES